MCGIAALVGSRASRELAGRMAEVMRHRGPNDAGLWEANGIALAFRRLSIIDLSDAGHQPMTSHCGRYRIVYNGEIYNYREVAQQLGDVTWRGSSDTEVLLEAFVRWGPACLDRLVGMFAFAIWDTTERRLFCARDRLGIKPFYFARLNDSWAIASEIDALLAAGVPFRPNDAVVYDFLARDFYEHTDETFFAEVRKLPAGHWMWLAEDREPQVQRYWDLAAGSARITPPADRTERGEELIARMADAVRLGLRSDVPVGITLSGGLDSAVLLALVDRARPDAARLETFSFDFEDERYSERPWVEAMSKHAGHASHFRTVTPEDFVSTFDLILAQQQEPHAGAPITAYTLCFEALHDRGVVVVMDGSGIDEGLAGYDRFRPAHWADLQRAGDEAELAAELDAVGASYEQARPLIAAAASEHGDVARGQDLTRSVRPDCLHPRLAELALPLPKFERPFSDSLRNLMYRELRYTKLPRALRFRDRLSMAYSCELRPPFLDHRLLEYQFALPARDRIFRGTTKVLLRDAAKTLLPDAVRLASKRSVQTPQLHWFRGPLASMVRDELEHSPLWDFGWVDRAAALRAVDGFLAGEGDNSFFVWQWMELGRWVRMYSSPRNPS
jgi:asparagine synthase (glutamine-hydrolysing)